MLETIPPINMKSLYNNIITDLIMYADGEVSNMIAPVKSMIGDTLILNWEFYD